MKVVDKVYGEFDITEPVLLELLSSPDTSRLKSVSQYGVPDRFHHKKNFSRYDHSVGVMLLLRVLGASLEEQIDGLLHDISHSSFSHIADWIFGEGQIGLENYQDIIQNDFLANTGIAKILQKHGYLLADVCQNPFHILLELNCPDICADRIDYTLRELRTDETNIDLQKILAALATSKSGIIFTSETQAAIFANVYLELQKTNWGAELSRVRSALLADAFRRALEIGILDKSDFWEKSEAELLSVLEASEDELIRFCINELPKVKPRLREIRKSRKKVRHVDPLVLDRGSLSRLSSINKLFAEAAKQSIEESEKIITLPHY